MKFQTILNGFTVTYYCYSKWSVDSSSRLNTVFLLKQISSKKMHLSAGIKSGSHVIQKGLCFQQTLQLPACC